MPYELLNRLCTAALPETVGEQVEIDKLQFLKEKGLVEADIPYAQPERGHHCYCGNAIVMSVTPLGHLIAKQGQSSLAVPDVSSSVRPSAPSPFL